MIVLGGATSFFVGNAFQAQMPEYAHHLGADQAGAWYSALLAANAAGAVLGTVLLETMRALQPDVRTAIACAAAWGVAIGLFPMARSYPLAVTLLVLAGVFNIAFTSMAQTLVQLLAPPRLRGSVVGLFNTAMLGLRAGSGVTVGVLGAAIDVQRSLALSALIVVLIAAGLLARETRRAAVSGAARGTPLAD
jgi:sugar phosphate permease